MSKETYVGGDIIETTGGDYKVFANGIENNAKYVIQNAKDCITCNEPKSAPKIETTVKKPCYCNRDFTVAEITNIITELRKNENIHLEQQFNEGKDPLYKNKEGILLVKKGKSGYYDLTGKFVQKDEPVRYRIEKSAFEKEGVVIFDYILKEKIQDTSIVSFTKEINGAFKKYEINTCVRKIHFLAQSYHESQRFHKSYESNPLSTVKGGEHYRGRGLLQLTHDYNYENLYVNLNNNKPSVKELFAFAPRVAKEIHLAVYASTYYWRKLGIKHQDINTQADKDDVLTVSKEINGYKKNNALPNGYDERVKYTNELKKIMEYEKCITKK